MRVVLLGPQRFRPTVRDAVRSLDMEGPIATVTAGWEEREPEDAELDDLPDGRSANLTLYRRWLDVCERDAELVAAICDRAGALAIAGGRVGVLLSCLRLFDVAAGVLGRPVVARWAGAMASPEPSCSSASEPLTPRRTTGVWGWCGA
jgi:hypothetical protein